MPPMMRVPSAGSAHEKAQRIAAVSAPRSAFDMSRPCKTTFDEGWLIPIAWDEVLPGDTWTVSLHAFARIATLIFPLMDNLEFCTECFFIPWRLVWDHTREFFGYQKNPGDSTAYTIPRTTSALPTYLPLFDYLGVNVFATTAWQVNVLLPRGYQRVWDEWYRDENLQNSQLFSTGDGPDSALNYGLLRRNKKRDYFSNALPWPQKGVAAVLPLAGTAPVVPNAPHAVPTLWNVTSGTTAGAMLRAAAGANTAVNITNAGLAGSGLGWDQPNLLVNLVSVTGGATISDFRLASTIQEFLERQARGGTRYPEYLWEHWRVRSSDARMQRTEYLGGSCTPLVISPIAQQSQTSGAAKLGTLAGVGVVNAHGRHGFSRSFEEHGFWIMLASVRLMDNYYQMGLHKAWKRQTLYDVADPAFANLTEQAVLCQEVWYDGDGSGTPGAAFGYQGRYDEYRQGFGLITSQMRSNVVGSYDAWHLAMEYASQPALNTTFIEENAPMDRVVADPTLDHFVFDAQIAAQVARVLPVRGVPSLMARF